MYQLYILIVWTAIKYYPSEMTTFPTLVNCSVCVVMYTYYLLIALDPHTQAIALQIKQYITIIQMVSISTNYTLLFLSPYVYVQSAILMSYSKYYSSTRLKKKCFL